MHSFFKGNLVSKTLLGVQGVKTTAKDTADVETGNDNNNNNNNAVPQTKLVNGKQVEEIKSAITMDM